ncbi:MAG: sigma 54-interacting transcriptional regulator, partial [Thermodesulfobacteriota bacterium]
DMSLKTQAKILRILQERKFERVGGHKTISVDVRVIAATNQDLTQAIKAGQFREDLYYRLNVIPIHLPPLRERREDIPLLAEELLAEIAAESGRPPKKFSPAALAALATHDWPGNVRELRNLIERLVILTPGEILDLDDLPEPLLSAGRRSPLPGRAEPSRAAGTWEVPDQGNLKEARESFERSYILAKLAESQGNISATAERLGLERSHLYKKLKSLGIRLDSLDQKGN